MSKSRCLVSVSAAALVVSGMLLSVPRAGWAQIEEIVVTTRKKAESLQEVPIAVDAFSADQLERQSINNVAELVKLSPSVQFDQSFGPQDVRIAVRGLSNTRGRSNVAFLVDGVDVTTENFISAGSGLLANQRLLVDVERVEIVKGPQSALFGRAAFAGAISYTTKEPGDEFEGQLRVEGGEFGLLQVDGAVSGPVAGLEDYLGARLTGAYWSNDGFYTNSVSGQPLAAEEGYGLAATLVFTPVDEARIKLRAEYSDSKVGQRPIVRIASGHHAAGHAVTDAAGNPVPYTEGPGDGNQTLLPYPDGALQINPDTGQPAIGAGSVTATGLLNFGQYCPDSLTTNGGDPTVNPGYCLPPSFGSASDWGQPRLSEDAATGQDYRGTETQLFRVSMNADMNYDWGTFTSITGWNNFNAFDELDQDYQAVGRPDVLKAHQQGRTDLQTDQFSQEFRFQSSYDAPVNFTLGALYWQEDRRQQDLNFIISCVDYGKGAPPGAEVWDDPAALSTNPAGGGICNGADGRISSWQERALDVLPCAYDSTGTAIPDPNNPGDCLKTQRTPQPWRAETEHWSAYMKLEWEIAENWLVEFEDRYVDETFYLLRPNKSGCSQIGFPFGTDVNTNPLLAEDLATTGDIACQSEQLMNPNIPNSVDANGNWFLIEGTTKSSYHTPKVTANWNPSDTSLIYFSWGRGQKPGGINTLSAGGFPTTIEDERFLPEIVDAWELGAKTDWEAAGFLQANGAIFLNDYTDKQIGTQIIRPNGQLQPRIVNAAAAQVWGLELELTWQPSFAEGLLLSGAYTYLDPTFTNFTDTTRSLVRAAMNGSCDLIYKQPGTPIIIPPGQGGDAFCALDLSGNNLERVPEHAFVGNAGYTRQFMDTGFDYFLELNATYEGKRFLDADNFIEWDDYWVVDVRAGLSAEKWEFLVYVKNLLDDDTIRTGGTGPDFGGQVQELGFSSGLGVSHYFGLLPNPQQFGATATLRF